MSERGRHERGASRASRLGATLAAGGLLVAAACGGDSTTGPSPSAKEVDLNLSVGESQRITADDSVLRVNVPGPDDGGAEYRVAVQSAADAPGAGPTVMRLDIGSGESSARVASPRRAAGGDRRVRSRDDVDLDGYAVRRRLQSRALEELQRRGVRPSAGRRDVRAQSMLPSDEEPQEGDILEFWFPADSTGSIDCSTAEADTVVAEVQAVNSDGQVAMVEDTLVEDGALDDMDYQALADEFDDTVFGTDVAYFGTPSDIDGNQRVLVLFTNKVNEFSAARTDGSDAALVTGFFLPTDLADSGDGSKGGAGEVCGASNEAEVLWLIAPDPDGSTGEQELTVEEATQIARSTGSHEFQHLLNLGNRLFEAGGGFNDAEETWLDEGLSHVAEEIIGLDKSGVALRGNLTFSDVTGSASQDSIFNTFLISDFGNLARHLKSPATTRALAANDPDDTQASLRMRGFAWMFLRWLADREHIGQAGAVPGSGDPEEAFFRSLAKANGSDLEAGVANIEGVTGRVWPDLVADFAMAMTVDDDEPQAPDRQQVLTWNLRNMYRQLQQATDGSAPFDREYPLVPTQNGFSPATFDFEVEAGASRYFTLGSSGSTSGVTLELTDQAGNALTSGSPQITVVRTR